MTLYRIIVGDWSDDGHGKTAQYDIEITSAHTVEELKANYQRNCERWGYTFETVARDYEDSSVPDDLYEKMKADGAKWECDSIVGPYEAMPEIGLAAGYQHPYLTPGDALQFAMDFIGVGLEPPLEWREVEPAALLIGGYSAQIEKSFGYGMFY